MGDGIFPMPANGGRFVFSIMQVLVPLVHTLVLTLGGCGAEVETPLQMKVDFSGNGNILSPTLYSVNDGRFYRNGFPSGLRQKADGRIDLADFPRPFQLVT